MPGNGAVVGALVARECTMTGSKRRYYDLDGAPMHWDWDDGKFPKVVTSRGENTVYDLARFLEQATPVTEQTFERMKLEVLRRPPPARGRT